DANVTLEDAVQAAEAAFIRYRKGDLRAAADAMRTPLRLAAQLGENAAFTDAMPDYLALSIEINIALGLTAEAERISALLDSLEQTLFARMRAEKVPN